MCSDRNELMQKNARENELFPPPPPSQVHARLVFTSLFLQASHSLLSESVAQVNQGCITRLSIDLFSLHALFPWYMSRDKKIFLFKICLPISSYSRAHIN